MVESTDAKAVPVQLRYLTFPQLQMGWKIDQRPVRETRLGQENLYPL